jgi:hypothetical protein
MKTATTILMPTSFIAAGYVTGMGVGEATNSTWLYLAPILTSGALAFAVSLIVIQLQIVLQFQRREQETP